MRKNDEGLRLCNFHEKRRPCPNAALWEVYKNDILIGIVCEDHIENAKKFERKNTPVIVVSIATRETKLLRDVIT